MRDRYCEEWLANLDHVPGKVTKLTWACGLLFWGVPRLRLQIRGRERGLAASATPETETRHADDESSRSGADPDPGGFCIKHRADWLGYALVHARNVQDAEDAVSHVAVKILQQHATTGTICPDGYDPVAWSKTVIANYIKDLDRRDKVWLK